MSSHNDGSPNSSPFADPTQRPQSSGVQTAGQDGSSGPRKEKKRVFFSGSPTVDERRAPRSPTLRPMGNRAASNSPPLDPYESMYAPPQVPPSLHHTRTRSTEVPSASHLPEMSQQDTNDIREFALRLPAPKQRPAIRQRVQPVVLPEPEDTDTPDDDGRKIIRKAKEKEAFERGKRLERNEQERKQQEQNFPSEPASSRTSLDDDDLRRHESNSTQNLDPAGPNQTFGEDLERVLSSNDRKAFTEQAHKLVQRHTAMQSAFHESAPSNGWESGMTTPTEGVEYIEDYRPPPEQYRGGILSSLLKLYNQQPGAHHNHRRSHSNQRSSSHSRSPSHKRSSSHNRSSSRQRVSRGRSGDYFNFKSLPGSSPLDSAPATPGTPGTPTTPTSGAPWFGKKSKHHHSGSSLVHLIGSSTSLGLPSVTSLGEYSIEAQKQQEKAGRHQKKHGPLGAIQRVGRSRVEEEIRITVHIAEIISRQKYLLKLCRALMLYGAPTHRLEEYMNMSARVLEIQAQFLYIPGSMIISFDDASTHTTEVKLIRLSQGLDLGKLRDTHEVYKDVVHDRIGVEEATARLKEIADKKEKHNKWVRILVSGIACATVGPFSFGARPIDIPICFALGTLLAFLQIIVAPHSDLYANVFEVTATIIASFLSRAITSVRYSDGSHIFCFAAVIQSSICMLLPGYSILCAALELQSKSMIAGSVRLVYAIIYSLFLGYGITIGSTIYGVMDKNATSELTCPNQMSAPLTYPFVIAFTMCMIMLYQAKWKQAPVQLVIAFVGYIVSYYSSLRFKGANVQISSTLSALAIGVLANLYSRIGRKWENVALDIWEDRLRPRWKALRGKGSRRWASNIAMKDLEDGPKSPDSDKSNFVPKRRRVGYGLAAAAMLPAIFVQVPGGLAVSGGLIAGIQSADQIAHAHNSTYAGHNEVNSTPLAVAYSVIQIAIGITVGLFLAALTVYPLGKRRSGLFSF